MSLARAGRIARLNRPCRPHVASRFSSSHAGEHDQHHHDAHADAIAFPREDFSAPIWRRFILYSLLAVGFYKFAPSPKEDNPFSRFLDQYRTPQEVWAAVNLKHLELSAQSQVDNLLVAEAKRPPVHRFRYPQAFEQYSPHLRPIGTTVDFGDLVIKGDKA
ncbi:unnamed protein product [Somion occarium]|uniref:Uncharacterized protein n=1 Tax=Somion occarium TaxID=3059160 RepID=A0ABP1DGP9_9APHY